IVKSSLDVALPEMTQDAVQDKKETLEVQMSTSGKVQWNTHSVSLAELDAFLTNQPAALPQGPLSISADKDLSHGDVIRLIDTFKKKGVKEISLNVIVH